MDHFDAVPSKPNVKKLLSTVDFRAVPWWTSQRFLLAIMCFLGFVVLFAQRVNLSIAIVSMVNHKGGRTGGNSSAKPTLDGGNSELCPEDTHYEDSYGEFNWDKKLQGLLLGAFYWGYFVLQIPGGRLSETLGATTVIKWSMFPVALLTILSPAAARISPYLLLAARVLIGVGESTIYPAVQALWSQWSPPNERSRLIGCSYAGGQFGNAITFPIAGYLAAYGFDNGWGSVFYVIGTCGFLWCIAWVFIATDRPEQNTRISEIEARYITFSIGQRAVIEKGRSTPWREMFTSRGVWAIIVTHMCSNFGAYMLLTQIPTYMAEVLKYDLLKNGIVSMLPYLLFWFLIGVGGTLADCLIGEKVLSVEWTRKFMTLAGMLGPATFLVATGFITCAQRTEAVVFLTMAVGLCGLHFSGFFINHGDIAPAYAGTLFGITQCLGTIPGFFAPYLVSAMTPNGEREEWLRAFYLAAGVYSFGAVFYTLMGQGTVQPWAMSHQDLLAKLQMEVEQELDELQREEEED